MFSCCWVVVELLKEREKLNNKHICLLPNAMQWVILYYNTETNCRLHWLQWSCSGAQAVSAENIHHDLERNQSHCSAAQKNFQEQCHDAVRR